MTDDSDGSDWLDWIHWPTVLKGLALGAGAGLLVAVVVENLWFGLLFGLVNGLAFGLGLSRSRGV